MPPRENSYSRPIPSDGLPPARRVDSVDGVAPRTVHRPAPIRSAAGRPMIGRISLAEPWHPPEVTPPPAPPALQPTQPIVSQQAAIVIAAAPLTDDALQLSLAGPTPIAQANAPAPIQPMTFAPPVKPNSQEVVTPPKEKFKKLKALGRLTKKLGRLLYRRQVLIPAGASAVLALVAWGAFAGYQYTRTQASPDTIYKDALSNALLTKQVAIAVHTNDSQTTSDLDLTVLKNPHVSSQTTAKLGGSSFGLEAYGTTADSYVKYTALPDSLAANTVSAIRDHWVQLRKSGRLPAGVNADLLNAADPRYQAFGPLLFANLPPKTSQGLASFLVEHHVYGYDPLKVTTVPLNGTKALLYTGKFDSGYAKVANQSLATSAGFSASDVQRIVDALEQYKDATSALYVDPGSRLPLQLVLTTTYTYSKFNQAKLPTQPSSNIDWPQFAGTQLQLEAQTSAFQPAADRDKSRQTNLVKIQTSLARYFVQNGFYPSLNNLNDQSWISANLLSFDPDVTRDPQAISLAFLAAAPVNSPTATNAKTKAQVIAPTTPIHGYIYQAATAAGKACANEAATPIDQQCSLYSLTATLSDGKLYTIKNP
jgi:hypothetical protein